MAGADGVVPGIGNVDPAGYVRLYEAARAGDWELAAAEQERLVALFAMVDVGPEQDMGRSSSALGSFKPALHLLGVIERCHRLPAGQAGRGGRRGGRAPTHGSGATAGGERRLEGR